jgi:hypothetical protein
LLSFLLLLLLLFVLFCFKWAFLLQMGPALFIGYL